MKKFKFSHHLWSFALMRVRFELITFGWFFSKAFFQQFPYELEPNSRLTTSSFFMRIIRNTVRFFGWISPYLKEFVILCYSFWRHKWLQRYSEIHIITYGLEFCGIYWYLINIWMINPVFTRLNRIWIIQNHIKFPSLLILPNICCY